MQCHDSLKLLDEFEVTRVYALNCRKRYLNKILWELEGEIQGWLAETWDDDWTVAFFICAMGNLMAARSYARRELRVIDKLLTAQHEAPNSLTDEMIETARQYPVDKLVEFVRGKAVAWCHDDRHPSMYYGSRKNLAVCPVCDKKFNPIDILIQRDGMSFAEAVRSLQ